MLTSIKIAVRPLILSIGLGLAFTAAPVIAKPQPEATATKRATWAPLMWVIKDEDSTIYLLGSFHMIKPGTNWYDERIRSRFDSAPELWLEIAGLDDQAAASQAFAKYALDPQKSLTNGMSTRDVARLDAALKKYGLTLELASNFKPWAVGLLLSVKMMTTAGYDPASGVDQVLNKLAKAQSKAIKGFETIDQQMAFFGSLDDVKGRQFLLDTLDQEGEGVALLETMMTAWNTGDEATLQAVINEDMKVKSPELYDVLITGRNKAWTPKILEILKGGGTSFIVVGVGHLIGPDSVQAQLRGYGVVAEPVY